MFATVNLLVIVLVAASGAEAQLMDTLMTEIESGRANMTDPDIKAQVSKLLSSGKPLNLSSIVTKDISFDDAIGQMDEKVQKLTGDIQNTEMGKKYNISEIRAGNFPGGAMKEKQAVENMMKDASPETQAMIKEANGSIAQFHTLAKNNWDNWNETLREKWASANEETELMLVKGVDELQKQRDVVATDMKARLKKFASLLSDVNTTETKTNSEKTVWKEALPGKLKTLSATQKTDLFNAALKTLFDNTTTLPEELS